MRDLTRHRDHRPDDRFICTRSHVPFRRDPYPAFDNADWASCVDAVLRVVTKIGPCVCPLGHNSRFDLARSIRHELAIPEGTGPQVEWVWGYVVAVLYPMNFARPHLLELKKE